ncbi:MAG: hypothetical protein QXT45_05260 [Candidatus Bilamarchaeaceae archaeon]
MGYAKQKEKEIKKAEEISLKRYAHLPKNVKTSATIKNGVLLSDVRLVWKTMIYDPDKLLFTEMWNVLTLSKDFVMKYLVEKDGSVRIDIITKALYEADKISSAAEAEKTIRSIMTSYEAKPKQWPFTGTEKGVPFLILEPKKYLKQKEIDEFMEKVRAYKEEAEKYKILWKYKYVFDTVERLYEDKKLTYGHKKTFEKYAAEIDAKIAMKKVEELEKAKSTKGGYLLPKDAEKFLDAIKKSIKVVKKTESTEDTKKLVDRLRGYEQLVEGGAVTPEDVKNLKDDIKKIEKEVTAQKEKPAPPKQEPLEIPGLKERRVRVPGMEPEEEKKEEKRETITITVFTKSAEKESDEKNIMMAEAVIPSSKWGGEGPGRDITINMRVTKNELAEENRKKTIEELTKKAVEALRNPPFSLKKSYTLKINGGLHTFYLESEVKKAIGHNLPFLK